MTGVFIAIIMQGLLSALMITRRNKKTFFFLFFYLLVVCSDFLFEMFLYNYFEQSTRYIEIIPSSFRLLKGPLLFLFTHQLVGKPINSRFYPLFFLPFFLCFFANVIALSNLFFDGEISANILRVHAFIFKQYYFYWYGFVCLSLFQLNRYYETGSSAFKAYKLFLSYLCITLVLYRLAYLGGIDKDLLRVINNYSFFIQFALLVNLSLRSTQLSKVAVAEVALVNKEKYQYSPLSKEEQDRIATLIHSYLKSGTAYIEEEFSLHSLAMAIGFSKHQVSQVITDTMQSNFYELVNTYRLELFLHKLDRDPSLSVSDLSYQVGFKSRTTFYKYFKSKVGLTPSEYKGQLKGRLEKTEVFS